MVVRAFKYVDKSHWLLMGVIVKVNEQQGVACEKCHHALHDAKRIREYLCLTKKLGSFRKDPHYVNTMYMFANNT